MCQYIKLNCSVYLDSVYIYMYQIQTAGIIPKYRTHMINLREFCPWRNLKLMVAFFSRRQTPMRPHSLSYIAAKSVNKPGRWFPVLFHIAMPIYPHLLARRECQAVLRVLHITATLTFNSFFRWVLLTVMEALMSSELENQSPHRRRRGPLLDLANKWDVFWTVVLNAFWKLVFSFVCVPLQWRNP